MHEFEANPSRSALGSMGSALLLVTLLALLLRLAGLGSQSLWVDEMLTLDQATAQGHGVVEQVLDDVQSPLPTFVLHYLSQISQEEWVLRLPSALLGSLAPLLLYLVVLPIAGGRAALLAALLLAIHPMHLAHSQEVRGYAWMLSLGLMAIALAQRGGDSPGPVRLLGVVLLATLCALGNMQGLFWMGGVGLAILLQPRISLRARFLWAGAFLLVLFLLAPWWLKSLGIHETARLLPGETTGAPLRGATTFGPWALPWAGFALAMGPQLGPPPALLHALGAQGALALPAPYLLAAGITALLVLFLSIRGLWALRGRAGAPLIWALIPIVLAVILALRNVKPFNPRYILAALPTLLLLVAVGLDRLPRRPALWLLLVWLALSGIGIVRHHSQPAWRHADIRGAAEVISERGEASDAILVPGVNRVFDHYYEGPIPSWRLPDGRPENSPSREADLGEILSDRGSLWYVRARPWMSDPEGELLGSLETNLRRVGRWELDGVDLRLYEVPRQGP